MSSMRNKRGKRRSKRRNGEQGQATSTKSLAQPKLHENMDEAFLLDEGRMVGSSQKIVSAKFIPLSLVMNKGGIDPPDDDSDSDSSSDIENEDVISARDDIRQKNRQTREDFSDVETHINHVAIGNSERHHIHKSNLQRYGQQQRKYNDYSFTQFHIKSKQHLTQQYKNSTEPESSDSDLSSDDVENETFFKPSNNFNYATDKPTLLHKEGENFGVDYLKTRLARKEKERQLRFEIESLKQRHTKTWMWCWEDYELDEFDDADFLDYQESMKRRVLLTNIVIFLLSFAVGMAILEHQMHFIFAKTSPTSKHNTSSSLHGGTNASSRWGHRFDDDAFDGNTAVFANLENELTQEEEKEELEKWEEYEMDAANVLANSAVDWDIHSQNGGLVDEDDSVAKEDKIDHWVQYFDQSSQQYYYFHKETNTTTWTKPDVVKGVVLLGVTRTGAEYVVEEFKDRTDFPVEIADYKSNKVEEESNKMSSTSIAVPSNFEPQEILDHYKDTYWRWNHPYRIPERTEVWGGIDTPVFWLIPNSADTTVEEIFEHCYHMVIAGTTGANNDGKLVLKRNITDHLSVYTLEDGAHYLNINLQTPEGINLARTAGLGQSGVADVILTRYIFNAADLFRDTGHTGRCFTFIRHPIERIISLFHALKRNNAPEVKEMSLDAYAHSDLAEGNWMTKMLTNTTNNELLTPTHFQVAKEVFGRKCLIGLTDHFEESMDRFSKFFHFESTHSINTHTKEETANFIEERRQCAHKIAASGVHHQYAKISHDSSTWKELERKNKYDMELYDYAKAMYYQQSVVYEDVQ